MAGITQTIPSFIAGMSEQPDTLKLSGQIRESINAIPDVTKGLFKRPGSQRTTANKLPLPNVQSGGSWFHYYRDETEGAYIGQIDNTGTVRIWSCKTGLQANITYGKDRDASFTTFDNGNLTNRIVRVFLADHGFDTGDSVVVTSIAAGIQNVTVPSITVLDKNSFQYVAAVDQGDHSDAAGSIRGADDTEVNLKNYLLTLSPENLQFLTINDTTFVSNRDNTNARKQYTTIGTTGSTPARPHQHFGFIELLRSENGRQYGLDLHGANTTVTTLKRATRIKIISDNLDEGDGTGHCPGIGTQVFSVDSGSKKNLIFRINTLGQQGVSPNYGATSAGPGGDDYRCSYNREAVLLHGGEGWVTGDTVNVTLSSAAGGASVGTAGSANGVAATYTISIEDHEETQINSTVVNADDGAIRPEPTPFDADTAVTTDTIIGGIVEGINSINNGNTIQAEQIGSGIYLHSTVPFSLSVVEDDLMRCFQSSVNDVSKLPNQCKHGYIVRVSNALRSEEDDYYLRFDGENNKSGSGSWSECALPGITKKLTNMPLVIERTALSNAGVATFTVRQNEYGRREVGDLITNPDPSFVGKQINKVLFFRNRIVFLSESNVITSRPGSASKPDFFIETALTVSASDPIDISSASMFPSELFDGIEVSTGLVVFSTNQQFLLSADDTVLNPDTAKLRSISTFNYNKNIPPISLGTTISYIDNSGKFSRLNEMANIRREGEPTVVEVSKVIPTTLAKNIDLLTNSRENSIILTGKTGSNIVIGYKYFQVAENRQQAAWFKWKFNNGLLYHFIRDDEYVFLDSNYFLQKIKLVQDDDPSVVDENEINYLLHLDNNTTIAGGQFSETTNTTTFSNVGWLSNVSNPIYQVALVDSQGRYGIPTVNTSNNTLTLTGNWSNSTLPSGDTSFTVGYTYDYEVKFPTIYPNATVGGKRVADINSSLVLHRIKLHFGKIGSYKTILNRVGKVSFTDQYESTQIENYDAGDVPYLSQFIRTVPIYERNVNVDIILKSTHPSPATLHSLSWEGDYSPKYYKRV